MEEINQKKNRFDYIDVLKAIAILCVITLHSVNLNINFLETNNFRQYINFFIRNLLEGVPVFIFVNGFLIINKSFELKKHLKKMLKIFIVLICWSIIDIVVISLLNSNTLSFKEILQNVFFTNINNKYTGPLWFLQSLLMLYFIFPVLKTVHDNNKKIYNYFFIIVSIFTVGLNWVDNLLIIVQEFTEVSIKSNFDVFISKYNPISNGSFLFFFMLGGYVFEYKDILNSKSKRWLTVFIGAISTVIVWGFGILISKVSKSMVSSSFNYSTIFTACIIIGLFALFFKYKNDGKIWNKFLTDIGKNSLGIYLAHTIIIRIFNKYIFKIPTFWIKLCFPLIVLLVSYCIVKIIKLIPKVRKLVEL